MSDGPEKLASDACYTYTKLTNNEGAIMKKFHEFISEGISSLSSASIYTLGKLSLAAIFSKMNSNSRLLRETNTQYQNMQILNSQIMLLAALIVKQSGNEKMLEYLEKHQEDDSIERLKTNALFERVQNEL